MSSQVQGCETSPTDVPSDMSTSTTVEEAISGSSCVPCDGSEPSAKIPHAAIPGMAPIKVQYIDKNHKRTLVEEFLDPTLVKKIKCDGDEAGATATEEKSQPKLKLKGRNKKRPVEKRQSPKERLCPHILNETTCPFGSEKCKYSHNISEYMDKKPPDLPGSCYLYDTFGRCHFGLSCRWAGDHVGPDNVNLIKEKLYDVAKSQVTVTNSLQKDIQNLLWKRKYDFGKAQRVLANNQNREDKNQRSGQKTEGYDSSGANKGVDHSHLGAADSSNSDKAVVEELTDQPRTAHPPAVEKKVGPCLDEGEIRVRSQEKKKIAFADKLYLAPLTTVGNLPFRRIAKRYGVDITCGEMAVSTSLLQGHAAEWALLKRHVSEDLFGVQICGSFPDTMTRCAQLIVDQTDVDFVDINCGCPIDLVFKRGEGCALMGRTTRFKGIVTSMIDILDRPLTVKIRTGIHENKSIAHTLVPQLRDWGVQLVTVHGRSREQRYTRMADWDYIHRCTELARPMPVFGNGDVLSFEDYNQHREKTGVSGVMVARGALIKPWIFTEIKEQRHWDISARERFDMLKDFTNCGLEHWGSDQQGVATTRRFLLEWLSFLHRYIPVGLLEVLPQHINEKPPHYFGRNDLETLLASSNCGDWIKLTEMLLGPVPEGFVFLPKHKASAYK